MGRLNSFLRDFVRGNIGNREREGDEFNMNISGDTNFIPQNEPYVAEARPPVGFDHG